MSDTQIENIVRNVINKSGFKKCSSLTCSVTRVVKMRHKELDTSRIVKITKSILS